MSDRKERWIKRLEYLTENLEHEEELAEMLTVLRENSRERITEPGEGDYHKKRQELDAQSGLPEQVLTMEEWLSDRIEQHEVFGDEVGSETDFKYLLLSQIVLSRCGKHFDTCCMEDLE